MAHLILTYETTYVGRYVLRLQSGFTL